MGLFKKKKWSPRGFLIDENLRINEAEIEKLSNCMNSTDKFRKGTSDKLLIRWCKDTGWVMVTKDIRMTILALTEGVPVLFVNDDYDMVALMQTNVLPIDLYKDLYNYFVGKVHESD